MVDRVIESIKKYGVGSCGPRGFYGTIGNILKLYHTHTHTPLFLQFNIIIRRALGVGKSFSQIYGA